MHSPNVHAVFYMCCGNVKRVGQSYRANALVLEPQLQEKYSFAMLALLHEVKEYT